MSSYTLGTIILIASSLILLYSTFIYSTWFKNGEFAALSIGMKVQSFFIWLFWVMAFVGSILLLQDKPMSLTILSSASYLILFAAFSQVISSLIRFFKGKPVEIEEAKENENEDDEENAKPLPPTILMTSIQFVIVLGLVLWFQNWLGTSSF